MHKKVCILGPVPPLVESVGGVAVFDVGLAEGFRSLGADVFLCSEEDECHDFRFYRIGPGNIRTVMEKEQPDLILASLHYGKYFAVLKKWGPKVLLLHGFFNFRDYGAAKTLTAVLFQKWMAKKADYVLCNSSLTRMGNGLFWNLSTDGVIPLGTTRDFMDEAEADPVIRNAANRRVVYVGRLVKSKQADKVIRAALLLHQQGFSFPLDIAGAGAEEKALRQMAAGDDEIRFDGFVPHRKIYSYFHEAEILVSLSEAEPFGITFAEALMAGCKIICPNTGGQTEFLRGYTDRVRFLPDTEPETIAAAIRELMGTPVPELSSKDICPQYDYRNTARKILEYTEK